MKIAFTSLVATMVRHVERNVAISLGTKKYPAQPTAILSCQSPQHIQSAPQ
jgi:hypothetical protein